MLCHRVLYQAWWRLFWYKKKPFQEATPHDQQQNNFLSQPLDFSCDIDEDRFTRFKAEDELEPLTLEDFLSLCDDTRDKFTRPERARAKRAGGWIADVPKFVSNLYICLLSISGTERLMFRLMKEQRLATWSGQYGLDVVPLVRYATPSKSPAVQILTSYCQLMHKKPADALPALCGFPGIDDLSQVVEAMFQILVKLQGHLWRRQVHYYTLLPWQLLQCLHSGTPLEERARILREWQNLPDCDIDRGYTLVLREQFKDKSPDELLSSPAFLHRLVLLALSKVTNSEVECNFARATGARSYMRGKSHNSSTMATKHCLAEIAHIHTVQCKSKNHMGSEGKVAGDLAVQQPAFKQSQLPPLSAGSAITTGSQSSIVQWHGASSTAPKKVTAWFLFRDKRLMTKPGLIGESKDDRRRRVIKEASREYHDPDFAEEVAECRSQAQLKNLELKEEKASRDRAIACAEQRSATSESGTTTASGRRGLLRSTTASDLAFRCISTSATGFGPWGAGDMSAKESGFLLPVSIPC